MRLKIGRFAKIDVYLHWTLVVLPVCLILYWRFKMAIDWLMIANMMGLVSVAIGCVLLHEFGHALTARRFGVKTRDIILTPIGGLARLESMPRIAMQEFLITLAGPLVNLVIACGLALVLWQQEMDFFPSPNDPISRQWLPALMNLNAALFLFNLVPAFPMDGGRILRSCFRFFWDFVWPRSSQFPWGGSWQLHLPLTD